MVKFIAFVLKYSDITQHGEAVCHTFWQEHLAMVVVRQQHTLPLSISGTAFADVHSHIQHLAAYAAHQFALSIRRLLKMETAQHAIAAHTLVVLAKGDIGH